MRIAILGGGTIGRLVLEAAARGGIGTCEVISVCGRSSTSRGAGLAGEFSVPYVWDIERLIQSRPDVVLESASHEAVRQHLVPLLEQGISVVVLSAGALADDALRAAAEAAARRSGARLSVPSGGIGGLDALRAACVAGVDEVSIQVAKPPAAWRGIPFVSAMGLDLDRITEKTTLFDGAAREGVGHFPQNVNIAAVLAMAGLGFERTNLKVVADPALQYNTHTIRISGKSGRITVILENVPSADNPKTALLAGYSAVAALRSMQSVVRYGT